MLCSKIHWLEASRARPPRHRAHGAAGSARWRHLPPRPGGRPGAAAPLPAAKRSPCAAELRAAPLPPQHPALRRTRVTQSRPAPHDTAPPQPASTCGGSRGGGAARAPASGGRPHPGSRRRALKRRRGRAALRRLRVDGARRRLLPVLWVRQQLAAGAAAAEQPLGGALRRGAPAGSRAGSQALGFLAGL
ncbi:gamma-glutamylcyclotransferase isoform X1 [Falco cherrug]|uniref:gamma-glutamylcyclotransferase isoform X1 n=1 Tax=Falco cherrug TaxID=345164 RepID=UPI00247A60B6|nr:gamma-glutamylcyclotransferase isoform X1 [Falco cherrug]